MWPLHRLGLHRNILEAPKFTVKGCLGLRPERFQNFQGFDEAPNTPLIRDTESRFRYVGTADPHPNDYAPLARVWFSYCTPCYAANRIALRNGRNVRVIADSQRSLRAS